MPLKRHHKIIIGSFSTLVVIFMVVSSIFLYVLYMKQTVDYENLNSKISEVKRDSQSQINDLSKNLLETEQELVSLGSQIGSLDTQLDELKASAGEDFSGIIEDSIKSVVTILTDVSQGTGFIIDEEGYVVTNYHVMEGATAATVYTYDSTSHAVSLVGYEPKLDLALLKIEGNYEKLILGDSDDMQVGQKVIAIGNPLGLQFSVSQGIVSAVHRKGANGLDIYIQTDAALNPGNSGGPLINTDGKVIGINNFKVGGSESLGFALESNYIEETVNEIAQNELGEILI